MNLESSTALGRFRRVVRRLLLAGWSTVLLAVSLSYLVGGSFWVWTTVELAACLLVVRRRVWFDGPSSRMDDRQESLKYR